MRPGFVFALVSMICGASAAAIAALWAMIARDSGMMMPGPADIADIQALMILRALATLFQLGTPVLAVTALILAVPGWREPMGKAGLLSAVFALTVYIAALARMAETIAA